MSNELQALGLPGDAIDWLSIEDAVRDRASMGVLAVYLGGGAAEGDLQSLLQADIRVAPLWRKDQDDPSSLPDTLSPINAIFWSGSGSDAARTLLRTLGLLEQERRVFISYRRGEGEAIAEQLWDRLTRLDFDVFLDRYRVAPAVNFQEFLFLELSDKAFVVLIESPTAHERTWIQHEVTYALQHMIGLLGLRFPRATGFPAIHDGFRQQLVDTDLEGSVGGPQRLAEATLNAVVERIEREHAQILRSRRIQLLESAQQFAEDARWQQREIADWTLLLERQGFDPAILRVSPRPPRASDVWRLDVRREQLVDEKQVAAGSQARLVHAGGARIEDRDLLSWVCANRQVRGLELAKLPDELRTWNAR